MSGTHRAARLCTVLLLIGAVSAGRIAHGYNIGFNSLAGPNGAPYTTSAEGGFTVNTIAGTWQQGLSFGNPTPSIFSTSSSGTVRITDSLNLPFTFSQVALAGVDSSTSGYDIKGYLSNVSVLPTIAGTLNLAGTFFTITNPSPSTLVDRLEITMSKVSSTSYNVDNILVHHIPEPSAVLMLALGMAGLAARRSRRALL